MDLKETLILPDEPGEFEWPFTLLCEALEERLKGRGIALKAKAAEYGDGSLDFERQYESQGDKTIKYELTIWFPDEISSLDEEIDYRGFTPEEVTWTKNHERNCYFGCVPLPIVLEKVRDPRCTTESIDIKTAKVDMVVENNHGNIELRFQEKPELQESEKYVLSLFGIDPSNMDGLPASVPVEHHTNEQIVDKVMQILDYKD